MPGRASRPNNENLGRNQKPREKPTFAICLPRSGTHLSRPARQPSCYLTDLTRAWETGVEGVCEKF